MGQTNSRVVLLGTGTPNADPDRSGPAVAVVVGQNAYVVDFGPGVVRRAAAAFQMGVQGLEVSRLNKAFVTHLHSDHTAGYADLILTPWVLGRREPLQVFGPPGTKTMTDHLLAAYERDIQERITGLEPANETGWRVEAADVKAGVVFVDEDVQVEAFPVQHGSWPAYGYRFLTPDRVIVISGDTRPVDSLVEAARGCDVLLHEVYSNQGLSGRPPEWQRYHSNVHTSARELGMIASSVRPGLLVLYHQLLWGVPESQLLAEIGEEYSGPVVSGKDLEVY